MGEEGWKSPTRIIAMVALAFSTFTFITGRADQARLAELEKSKLEIEQVRADLDAEIRRSSETRAQNIDSNERRVALSAELEAVKKDLYAWQGALLKSEPALLTLRSELQAYEDSNRQLMAEATRKKIAQQEQMVAQQQQELQAVFRRRAELEAQLQ